MEKMQARYPRLMTLMNKWNSFKIFESALKPQCKETFCSCVIGQLKAPRKLPLWVMQSVLERLGVLPLDKSWGSYIPCWQSASVEHTGATQ